MRRLLVTGGAGFIGSNFVHHWLAAHPGERLVVLDALSYAGNPQNLAGLDARPEFRFVHGDIGDTPLVEELLRSERIDTLVHFAAESHVDRSITGPDAVIQANVNGTHSLLKAARTVWLQERAVPAHRFHHVSSDEVYGSLGPSDPAFTEETRYAPNSPYSASKAASDHLVRAYHHTYGLDVTTSNCSNNYGPRHFPEKLIPLIIVNILRGLPLPIYGDGRNVRDWLHVDDHCRGIELVLAKGRPGEVYNLGGGAEAENIVLVRQLCTLIDGALAADAVLAARFPQAPFATGREAASLITFVPDRPGHDRRYAIDCGKAHRELGYGARLALDAGLRATVAWYLENESWWRAVLDGSYQKKSPGGA
jgi:dTDP-glucose 4,6-dehydratase